MDRPVSASEAGAVRNPTDASVLLVELGRALKAWHFYPADHPARIGLLDRATRAWQGELQRGPLELEIRRGCFWMTGSDAVGRGHLDDLARQFTVRSIRRLRVHPDFELKGLCAFLEMLSTDPEALERAGGAEAALLRMRAVGFQVNDADYAALLAGPEEAEEPEDETALEFDAADGEDANPEPTFAEEPTPTGTAPEQELNQLLAELDGCEDDSAYRDLAEQVAERGGRMAAGGDVEPGLAALRLLVDHAGDDAKRSFAQREMAHDCVERLLQGPLLEAVLEQIAGSTADVGLRATEMLLLVGARAAPRLLDCIEREEDADRRQRTTAAFLTMGDEALPVLERALDQCEPGERSRLVRLAGETQNPRLVPVLRQVLLHGADCELRDAGRSLVRIGDVGAVDALVEGLASHHRTVVEVSAYCLGAVRRALAVGPLTHALDRALAGDQIDLAREIVRSLGRLGRAEAVPALTAVLARRSWFRPARLRELKAAAITSLSRLPGHDAFQALSRAASGRNAVLRQAATDALERRGGGGDGT